ncbi:MAG: DUF2061 domain-containing protein [bacterium]|nr:DUF2061 domain-containing protein [bacterium]
MKETHTRSVTKGLSYRIVAATATIILVFLFTGNTILSFGIGFSDLIIKTLLYYLHERIWNTIKWGKR